MKKCKVIVKALDMTPAERDTIITTVAAINERRAAAGEPRADVLIVEIEDMIPDEESEGVEWKKAN